MTRQTCKILIVDDEVDLAEALGALLGRAGYACAVCTDGARAYDAVVAESPDLVLTDLRKSAAPSRMASTAASSVANAVSRMTGRAGCWLRTFFNRSIPLVPGILRSVRTRSGDSAITAS